MTDSDTGSDTDRLERAEERISHLLRAVEELSDLAADQAVRIARLEQLAEALAERQAERDADSGGGVLLGDERPPHW